MADTKGNFDEIEKNFQKEKRLRENFNKCTLSDEKNICLTIKMQRTDEKGEPHYTLTICGDGKVIYEGIKNVKVHGMRESFIEKEKLKDILDKLEDTYFFSLTDYSSIEGLPTEGRDLTKISVTIEDDTKEFTFPSGDAEYSGLTQLGGFIDFGVNSKQWVS